MIICQQIIRVLISVVPDNLTMEFSMLKIGDELDRIGRQGKAAWQRLKKDKNFEDWRTAGQAVVTARQWAMNEAGTNQPIGSRYNALMADWLARYGLDDMDKGARSRLVEMMDNIGAIEEWRKTLTLTERLSLNHPNSVVRKWKAATTIKETDPAEPKETVRTELAKALERIAELEAENAQLKAHVEELEAARDCEREVVQQ